MDLREAQSFHRSALSSKLEEADPFKQIDPSYVDTGPVDTDTKSEQNGSYRHVAQGWLHTSDNELNLDTTLVVPESAQPLASFRPRQT